MEKKKTRGVGRRRWAELIRFLKTTMQTAKSERVRMAAAERLADILTLREQREQLELKAALREAEKNPVPANDPGMNAPEQAEPAATPEGQYAEVWGRVLKKDNTDV